MKLGLSIVVLAAAASISAGHGSSYATNCTAAGDVFNCIDPRISTGGFGFGVGGDPVGAQVPFGAMRLSPDTVYDGNIWLVFQHLGGYSWNDTWIRAFSHTHMVGPGVADYGNIGVMPVRKVEHSVLFNQQYHSEFSHDTETMQPGYYSVQLKTAATTAELTACGTHAGVHRYTFQPAAGANGSFVIFDMSHSLDPKASVAANTTVSYNATSNVTEITGWVLNDGSLTGRNGRGVDIFFIAHIAGSVPQFGVWGEDYNPQWGASSLNGTRAGAFVKFADSVKAVEISVALSFISLQQARRNLQVQVNGRSFDQCRQSTQTSWRQQMSAVQVTSAADPSDLIMFYTALYHIHMPPTTWTEVDNVYLAMNSKQVMVAPTGRTRYTDLSIWDIFRTQIPLLTILRPDVAQDIGQSLVGMYQEGGDIPRWPIANVYTGCMIGSHANMIISELVVKNLTNFDIQTAYQGMRLQATDPNRPHIGRDCLSDYMSIGYVPQEHADNSVSLTLAYSYDDWALSNVAGYLGQTADQALFLNRSKNYRHVFNSKNLFMCAKTLNGTFKCPEDPAWNGWIFSEMSGFTEGDGEQWRWFVPHDLPGLVELFGGADVYVAHLDRFFNLTALDQNTDLPNPFYWAGNEPGILEPFQFNVAGRADLTQKWSRAVIKQSYNIYPHGVPGNDDYGALSGWLVFAMLGFYPLAGSDRYFLGSPTFQQVNMTLMNTQLTVNAYNASHTNIYVEKAAVNGQPINMTQAEVRHSQLFTPGTRNTLEFWMSSTPSIYG